MRVSFFESRVSRVGLRVSCFMSRFAFRVWCPCFAFRVSCLACRILRLTFVGIWGSRFCLWGLGSGAGGLGFGVPRLRFRGDLHGLQAGGRDGFLGWCRVLG